MHLLSIDPISINPISVDPKIDSKTARFYLTLVIVGLSLLSTVRATAVPQNQSVRPSDLNSDEKVEAIFKESGHLSPESVTQMEKTLRTDPNNLLLRLKLLGYYHNQTPYSKETRLARKRHIVWMIQHYPGAVYTRYPFCQVSSIREPETLTACKSAWQQQIARHPTDASVLRNAAAFIDHSDPDTADHLREIAAKIETRRDPTVIAYFRYFTLASQTGEQRAATAREVLKAYGKELSKAREVPYRIQIIRNMAECAYISDQFAVATTCANELLKLSTKTTAEAGPYAFYNGKIMLGRIALHAGNIQKAEAYLHEATNPPVKAKQVAITMSLARELLERGEQQVVLDFLEEIRSQWSKGDFIIDLWIKQIKQGKTPDLGTWDLF